MKSTTALRAARKLIENRRYNHVCLALKYAYPGNEGTTSNAYRDIQRSLNNYIVVDAWLQDNVPEFLNWSRNTRGCEYTTGMREYRLRWIDEMIAQYEAKGD